MYLQDSRAAALEAEMGLRVPISQAELHKTLCKLCLLSMWGHICPRGQRELIPSTEWTGGLVLFQALGDLSRHSEKRKGKENPWDSGKRGSQSQDLARPYPLSCSISVSGTADLNPAPYSSGLFPASSLLPFLGTLNYIPQSIEICPSHLPVLLRAVSPPYRFLALGESCSPPSIL